MVSVLQDRGAFYLTFLVVYLLGFGLEFAYARNVALGARYVMESDPAYEHTRDPLDKIQLTDGKYTSRHFWTTKTTVGWQQTDPIRIEIDLGKDHQLSDVCVNTARGEKADVSFPDRVDIFVSLDRDKYTYLGNVMQQADHQDGLYQVMKFCAGGLSAVGRYVWLFVQPRGPYTFIDEIEVLDQRTSIAGRTTFDLLRKSVEDYQKKLRERGHAVNALRFAASRLRTTLDNGAGKEREHVDAYEKIRSIIGKLDRESALDDSGLGRIESDLLAAHVGTLSNRFGAPIVIWRGDPWATFTIVETPKQQEEIVGVVNVDLLRRGAVSDAVNLTNASGTHQKVRITVQFETPRRQIPTVILREAMPIVTARARVRADPLLPLSSGEVVLRPGESKQIWITTLALDSEPGLFSGRLLFESLNGFAWTRSVPFEMRIWRGEMPRRQNVMVTNWAYLNWRPIEKVPEKAVNDLMEHHTNVFVIHPLQLPWPKASGKGWAIDYTDFDSAVRQHQGAEKYLFFMLFNDTHFRGLRSNHRFMSKEWKDMFTHWIKDWVGHIRELGLGYDQFAFYPFDEPRNEEDARVLFDTATVLKEIDPKIRVHTTLLDVPLMDLTRLARVVDVFQLRTKDLSGLRARTLKGLGKDLWSYTASGGGKDADPLAFYRNQAWQAYKAGASGIGFWAYADSGSTGSVWNDMDGRRPDYAVIYDFENGIISSKRWEAWREGVEDFELLALAQARVTNKAEQDELSRHIDRVLSYPADYQMLLSARRWLLSIASR